MWKHRKRKTVALVAFAILSVCGAYAAQIVLGTPVSTPGGGLAVSVSVAPGTDESVAAVQFDMEFDASRFDFTSVVTGDAAIQAGKDAMFSEPESGVARVIVAGFNQESMRAGEVATLYFLPVDKMDSDGAFAESSALAQAIVSDPFGGKNDAAISVSTDEETGATSASTDYDGDSATATPAEESAATSTQRVNADATTEPMGPVATGSSRLVSAASAVSAELARSSVNTAVSAPLALAGIPERSLREERPLSVPAGQQEVRSSTAAPARSSNSLVNEHIASAAPTQETPAKSSALISGEKETGRNPDAVRFKTARLERDAARTPFHAATSRRDAVARRSQTTTFVRNGMIAAVIAMAFAAAGIWIRKRD